MSLSKIGNNSVQTEFVDGVVNTSVNTSVTLAAPSGTVLFFAFNTAPEGWLKANGALVSRTTYADLFAAIGTTFGAGDESTTFALPDLRGEFPRGWDDGRGVDSARSFGANQSDGNRSHQHFISGNYHTGNASFSARVGFNGFNWGGGNILAIAAPTVNVSRALNSDDPITFNTIGAESAGISESRPRNISLLACIKF
jgi:microcystin-dependent protein